MLPASRPIPAISHIITLVHAVQRRCGVIILLITLLMCAAVWHQNGYRIRDRATPYTRNGTLTPEVDLRINPSAHQCDVPPTMSFTGVDVQSNVYLHAYMEYGGGIGDMAQQLMHVAVLAHKHNVNFLTSEFLIDRDVNWSVLGLQYGDMTVEQLTESINTSMTTIKEISLDAQYSQIALSELQLVDTISRCEAESSSTICIIHLLKMQLPYMHEEAGCQSRIIQQMKRKYCHTRVSRNDSASMLPPCMHNYNTNAVIPCPVKAVPVAVHWRGGDVMNHPTTACGKKMAMGTVTTSISAVHRLLLLHGYKSVFHIFTQAPGRTVDSHQDTSNLTPETLEWLAPLLHDPRMSNINLQLHVDTKHVDMLFAMVSAPVILGGGSGMSIIYQYLRTGLTIGRRHACDTSRYTYLAVDGYFDEAKFSHDLLAYAAAGNSLYDWSTYDDAGQCDCIAQLPPLQSYSESLLYSQQQWHEVCNMTI